MNLTLNNFLSRLKNTSLIQKENVIINFNNIFLPVLQLLYREGVILTYTSTKNKKKKNWLIKLRYHNDLNCLKKLKVMSKPSKPLYFNKFEVLKIYERNRIIVFSTSKGILTSLECKKKHIGGELLFII